MKAKIYSLLSGFWALFIFSNSLKVGAQSDKASVPLTQKLSAAISNIGINIDHEILHMLVRKTAHLTEFLILGAFITLAVFYYTKNIKSNAMLVLFLCLASGVIDEFIQSFVPNRSGEVRDIIIDFTGGLIGFLIIALIKYKKTKRA